MTDNKEHISAFDHLEVSPPDAVWDRLEQSLPAKKKGRKLILFRLVSGVAAIALLLIGIHAYWNSPVATPETLTISEVVTPEHDGLNPALATPQETIDAEVPVLTAAAKPKVVAPTKRTSPTHALSAPFGESRKEESKEGWPRLESLSAQLSTTMPSAIIHHIQAEQSLTLDEEIMRHNLAQMEEEKLNFSPAIGTQYSVFNSLNNTSDNTKNSLAGGINVSLESNKRFGLQTGIYYAQLEQNSRGNYQAVGAESFSSVASNGLAIAEATQSTSWGNVAIAEPEVQADMVLRETYDAPVQNKANSSTTMQQRAAYLEIPLIMRYTLIDQRVGVEVLGGFNNSFLINNRASYAYDGRTMNASTEDLKAYNTNSVAGVALNYSVTEQLNLGIEPKFKYYFNSLSENKNINFRPVVFGVYTGLTYHF